jgi:serine/threonine protein kinase
MIIEHSTQKPSLEDFLLLTVIGKGAYAKVVLVRRIRDEKVLALKIIKKKGIERKS